VVCYDEEREGEGSDKWEEGGLKAVKECEGRTGKRTCKRKRRADEEGA
jgi:hypothetical protein